MRVVVAPDSLKGTLSAAAAARAMREGWLRARPDDEVVAVPMADGGDGTLDVLADVLGGARRHELEVVGPLARPVRGAWLDLGDGRAFVESAQACGLALVPADRRDPRRTTSWGVGELLAAAARAGARQVLVGLGGSAVVEGGAGMAGALGHRLRNAAGNGVKVGGAWLHEVDRVLPTPGPLAGTGVLALADVRAPLLGPEGAARVFGPQKGADAHAVELLERGLGRLADAAERDLPGGPGSPRWRDQPGAGAAGGLGFGLLAFAGARLVSGAATVADLVGLHEALRAADVVLTAEGSFDTQTGTAKAPGYVLEQARGLGARLGVVAGRVTDGAALDAAAELGERGLSRPVAAVAEATARLAGELTVERG